MSVFGDILKAAEAVPGVGMVVGQGAAIGDLLQGNLSGAGQNALAGIPGVGTVAALGELMGGGGGGGGGGGASASSQSSSGAQASNWSPQNQISQFLSQYDTGGATADQVYSYLKSQYPGNVANQKNLATALQNFASDAQWTPQAAGNQSAANIIDPQAVQQFFSQTIAPYMKQVGNNAESLYHQILSTPNNPNLPSQYQAIVQQGRQNMAQDMLGLSEASQAAGLAQPQINTITTLLGNAQKAALQNYYRMLNTSTLTNTPASFANLGSSKSNPVYHG